MSNSIASIIGTNEECVKMNSHTKVNLMNIQGVMSICSCKEVKFLSWLQGKLSTGITLKLVCTLINHCSSALDSNRVTASARRY